MLSSITLPFTVDKAALKRGITVLVYVFKVLEIVGNLALHLFIYSSHRVTRTFVAKETVEAVDWSISQHNVVSVLK